MDLTLEEIEEYTGLSRSQISRHAAAGRLCRTRQGHYDAVSLAGFAPPFTPSAASIDRAEDRAVWLVRSEYAFRRNLRRIVKDRHRPPHANAGQITPSEQREIDEAVKGYVRMLRSREVE